MDQSQHLVRLVDFSFLLIADADPAMHLIGWLGSQQNTYRSVSAISSAAKLKLPADGLAGRQLSALVGGQGMRNKGNGQGK